VLTDRCVWVPQNSASVALRASAALFALWFCVVFLTAKLWLVKNWSCFGDLSASDRRPRLARGEANPSAQNKKIKAPQGPDSEGKLDLRERVV
jgi:hypothetical protein